MGISKRGNTYLRKILVHGARAAVYRRSQKTAGKKAIVTHLTSMEELAGIDVPCSDKTGTLTQNKLTLGDAFCVDGSRATGVILAGSLASRAES